MISVFLNFQYFKLFSFILHFMILIHLIDFWWFLLFLFQNDLFFIFIILIIYNIYFMNMFNKSFILIVFPSIYLFILWF